MSRLLLLTLLAGPPAAQVTPIAPGVYVHTTYQQLDGQPFPANGLIIDTPDGVVLVDSGWGAKATAQLLRWVRQHLHRPVRYCIVSHFHADRIGGIGVLKKHGVRTLCTPLTARLASAKGITGAEAVLSADTTLTVGGVAIRTFFPGAGHAPDNIVVWLPATRILAGGCFVKSCDATDLGNMGDADTSSWPGALHRVQQTFPTARIIVPGHQSWTCPDPLTHTLQLLQKPAGTR
jgi:metallo-beta-lactamase class B